MKEPFKFKYEYTREGDDERVPFESNWGPEEAEYVAEDAGECEWSEHDGWEASWPQVFEIFAMGASLGRFSVDMEAVPHFHGKKLS